MLFRSWGRKYDTALHGRPQHFETSISDKEQQEHWQEIFLHPIYDLDRNVVEVSCIGHDITYKKEADRQIKEQAAKITSRSEERRVGKERRTGWGQYDEKVKENEKRQKEYDDAVTKYEEDTEAFNQREIEANKTNNKKVSFGSESKIGMVPTEFLREAVGKLIEDPTQLLNMATNEDGSFKDFDEDEMIQLEKITKNIIDSMAILIDKKLDLFSSNVYNK